MQRHGGKYRAGPRPKVLRRNVIAGDFFEVGVDVAGGHVLRLAILIEVLQQLLAGQFLAGPDDLGDPSISHAEEPLLAALARKPEAHLVSIDCDMPVLQGRQAITVVLLGVVVIADSDESGL